MGSVAKHIILVAVVAVGCCFISSMTSPLQLLRDSDGYSYQHPRSERMVEECVTSCECGIPRAQRFDSSRVINGKPVEKDSQPWVAGLRSPKSGLIMCGGTLINNKYILTAAHCITKDWSSMKVELGRFNQSDHTESGVVIRKVSEVIIHPDYVAFPKYHNDIALLKLDQTVPYSLAVWPACLATSGDSSYSGKKATVSGWGQTSPSEADSVSDVLMTVTVEVFSNDLCNKQYQVTSYKILDTMVCAGDRQGKKDSCTGDSGGPLWINNNKQMEVIGVVSTGRGCASKVFPAVYTRVTSYKNWIAENTKEACYCSSSTA